MMLKAPSLGSTIDGNEQGTPAIRAVSGRREGGSSTEATGLSAQFRNFLVRQNLITSSIQNLFAAMRWICFVSMLFSARASAEMIGRPISAGQGSEACSSGDDQIQQIGVMIEVNSEPLASIVYFAFVKFVFNLNCPSLDTTNTFRSTSLQALTCVESVNRIAVFREKNLVCEAVSFVSDVSLVVALKICCYHHCSCLHACDTLKKSFARFKWL